MATLGKGQRDMHAANAVMAEDYQGFVFREVLDPLGEAAERAKQSIRQSRSRDFLGLPHIHQKQGLTCFQAATNFLGRRLGHGVRSHSGSIP